MGGGPVGGGQVTTVITHASFLSYPQVLRQFWYILRLSIAGKRVDTNLIT
jgi:hypothetical protein